VRFIIKHNSTVLFIFSKALGISTGTPFSISPSLIKFFKINGLNVAEFIPEESIDSELKLNYNQYDDYIKFCVKYKSFLHKTLIELCDIIDNFKCNFLFIKLTDTMAIMNDIDILYIPSHKHHLMHIIPYISKKLSFLGTNPKLRFYSKLEAPTGKLTLLFPGSFSIDFYPQLSWGRFLVEEGQTVYRRKVQSNMLGVSIPTPSPIDQFYITCTHSFFHGNITLRDIIQCLTNLRLNNCSLNNNIGLLNEILSGFGTRLPVYTYSIILSRIIEMLNYESTFINELIDKTSSFIPFSIQNYIKSWSDHTIDNCLFPVKIPSSLILTYKLNYIKTSSYKKRNLTSVPIWILSTLYDLR
jgi:hypothetical protein